MHVGDFSELYNVRGEDVEDEDDYENQRFYGEGFDHIMSIILLVYKKQLLIKSINHTCNLVNIIDATEINMLQ